MDYVAFASIPRQQHQAERDAALMRRAAWEYPKGIRVIAEYWPASEDVQVVSIFSADEFGPIWEFELEWGDAFNADVSPATSAADGLRIGAHVMGRLHRLK